MKARFWAKKKNGQRAKSAPPLELHSPAGRSMGAR